MEIIMNDVAFARPSLLTIRSLPTVRSGSMFETKPRGQSCSPAVIMRHSNNYAFSTTLGCQFATYEDITRIRERLFALNPADYRDRPPLGRTRSQCKNNILTCHNKSISTTPVRSQDSGEKKESKSSTRSTEIKLTKIKDSQRRLYSPYRRQEGTMHYKVPHDGIVDRTDDDSYDENFDAEQEFRKDVKNRHHRRATTCDNSQILDLPSSSTCPAFDFDEAEVFHVTVPTNAVSQSLSPQRLRPQSVRNSRMGNGATFGWAVSRTSHPGRKRSWVVTAWKWASKKFPNKGRQFSSENTADVYYSAMANTPLRSGPQTVSGADNNESDSEVVPSFPNLAIPPSPIRISDSSPKPYFLCSGSYSNQRHLSCFEYCLRSGIDVTLRDRRGKRASLRTLFLDDTGMYLCWLHPGAATLSRDPSHSVRLDSVHEFREGTGNSNLCLFMLFSDRDPLVIEPMRRPEHALLSEGLQHLIQDRQAKMKRGG